MLKEKVHREHTKSEHRRCPIIGLLWREAEMGHYHSARCFEPYVMTTREAILLSPVLIASKYFLLYFCIPNEFFPVQSQEFQRIGNFFLLYILFRDFLFNFYIQCGAHTHNLDIKSRILYWPSQPGTLRIGYFKKLFALELEVICGKIIIIIIIFIIYVIIIFKYCI